MPRPLLTDTPASPTTISRPRPRIHKRGGNAALSDCYQESESHVISAATSAATPRPLGGSKLSSWVASHRMPANDALLTLHGCPILPVLKQATVSKQLFGDEIQDLMNGFGEFHFCTRDVLVLFDDAKREADIRLICHTDPHGDVTV